jgi:hypothetical protein
MYKRIFHNKRTWKEIRRNVYQAIVAELAAWGCESCPMKRGREEERKRGREDETGNVSSRLSPQNVQPTMWNVAEEKQLTK